MLIVTLISPKPQDSYIDIASFACGESLGTRLVLTYMYPECLYRTLYTLVSPYCGSCRLSQLATSTILLGCPKEVCTRL